MSTDSHDLYVFLDRQEYNEFAHFVLPGAVVSGRYVSRTPETIMLDSATVYTGSSQIEIDTIRLPIERILAWGEGEIRDAQTKDAT